MRGSIQVADLGLGGVSQDPKHHSKFKTPHLRDIQLTAPYMHNGLLKTLKQVVNFHNTRDVEGLWVAPEVTENVEKGMVGDLGFSGAEEDAIVAFLLTLTDAFPFLLE